jgi:multidrug efflux pump subunit AcrB
VAAAVVTFTIWGVVALWTLPRQEDPVIGWRLANVVTRLPGASPSRVESLITDVIEQTVREVDEVEHVYSVSRSGVSLVQVELGDDVTNVAPVWQKVRHKLLEAARELPEGTIGPELNDEVMGTFAVVAAIRGEDFTFRQLKDQAERLEDRLRYLPNTASTELIGVQQEVIQVELDQAKLASYNLSFDQVAATVNNRNTRLPSGRLEIEADELLIEASGAFENETELGEMVLLVTSPTFGPTAERVRGQEGVVRLRDVATIRRTTASPADPLARFDGQTSVMVGARARSGVRVDNNGATVEQYIDEFRSTLPQGMEVDVLHNLARSINQLSGDLGNDLWQSIALVFLSTVIFIGWRSTWIVSTSIPLTALVVLVLFSIFGVPLNQMSVMALIMAMGMDVDCATVVTEQIQHRWRQGGDLRQIAAEEASHLFMPLAVSTLITVAAFLPIYLLPGGTGEFVRAIPVGVSVCLLMALIVSVTVVPVLCTLLLKKYTKTKREAEARDDRFSRFVEWRNAWYQRFLERLTAHPAVVLCLVVTIMVGMTSVGLLLRRDFFSPVQRDQFIIDVYTPQGSSLANTLETVKPIEALLGEMPEVTSYGSFVGRNAPLVFYNLWVQETYANHFAQIVVNVTDWHESAKVAARVQEQLQTKAPGADCVVHILEHGAPFVAPFEVRITGPSLETLGELGRRAKTVLANSPGVRNVRDNYGNEALQLIAQVNEPVARAIGVDQGRVANELRYRLDGLVASHLQEGDERVDIRVRLAGAQREDIADLGSVYFKPTADAPLIPFATVATLEPSWETASIYRRDGQRTLSVLAYPDFGLTAAQVSKEFTPQLDELAANMPPGYSLEFGGESEQRHEAESNLRNKAIYTFCIIILLLIAQFHSFQVATMILSVIPLSLGGAMVGLWLTGYPLNFMAIMGMMMLVGVMVTNAIILVEGFEQRRAAGQPMRQLVIDGTRERTLHVVVTSVNTITGFIPLALSHSPLWPPLAIAIIGGLTMSTVICLVAIPSAYVLFRKPAAALQSA